MRPADGGVDVVMMNAGDIRGAAEWPGWVVYSSRVFTTLVGWRFPEAPGSSGHSDLSHDSELVAGVLKGFWFLYLSPILFGISK